MRKPNNIHLLLLIFLAFTFTSCSINKNAIENNGIVYGNKHFAHSGKFDRCALCAGLLVEKQTLDPVEVYSNKNAEQEAEQVFASTAETETFLLKSSKKILAAPVIDISIENKNTESAFIKKKSKRALEKKSEPKYKKNVTITLLFSIAIISLMLALIGPVFLGMIIIGAFFILLLLGIMKLIGFIERSINGIPTNKKIYWYALIGLIFGAIFMLLVYTHLVPIIIPIVLVYFITLPWRNIAKI